MGPLSSATCPPILMQLTDQNNGGTVSSAFLLARKGHRLAKNLHNNTMRNATCMATQTFK